VGVAASRRQVAPSVTQSRRFAISGEAKVGSNSDQGRGCCHCPSRLVSVESSESCLLLLLMGKKAAESFKEKSFMGARLFFR